MRFPQAKKRLGQNFLVDPSFAQRIVREMGVGPDETVLEIGPGHGALTTRLVETRARVVAIEFDRDLVKALRQQFASNAKLTILAEDALETDFCLVIAPATTARVVANLPYNISSPILRRLIDHRRCISEMILMLQREVVDRIVASPASRDRGFLSVFAQAYCETEKLFDVPPEAFRPVPKVWSTVVRLRTRERLSVEVSEEALMWNVVSAGFAHRRKTIFNNLRAGSGDLGSRIEEAGGVHSVLEAAEVDSRRRAETLDLDEWAAITRALEEGMTDEG